MQQSCQCHDIAPAFCPVHDAMYTQDAEVAFAHRLGEQAKRQDRQEEVRDNRRRKQAQGSMKQSKGAGPPGMRIVHAVRRRTQRAA